MSDVTRILSEVEKGDQAAAKQLLPLVYKELRKLAAAKALVPVKRADWVLVCDVDEFLVIHRGAGRISDLIPSEADFLGMAINWRVFGTSGRVAWEDGLVHRQFLHAAKSEDASSAWVKTIHAQPKWFRRLGEHGPKRLLPRHATDWGTGRKRWF